MKRKKRKLALTLERMNTLAKADLLGVQKLLLYDEVCREMNILATGDLRENEISDNSL